MSLLILVTGCDRYTRYKVLTFFFTGVPPFESGDIVTETTDGTLASADDKRLRRTKKLPPFEHGPYAARQCELCHEMLGTKALKKGLQGPSPQGAGDWQRGADSARRLTAPLRELCIQCHITKSSQSAYTEGLWMHGPVSDGLCIRCHNYHLSPYPFMLLNETSTETCGQCHTEGLIMQIEEHKEGKECTVCHNPHMGKDRFLLKKDFVELY